MATGVMALRLSRVAMCASLLVVSSSAVLATSSSAKHLGDDANTSAQQSAQHAKRKNTVARAATTPIKYELKFEKPNSHLMDVTMWIDGLSGATADVAIPDWAPGSYYIENYSANVQNFSVTAAGNGGASGAELKWQKTDSQTWRIDLAGATAITVNYKIFGNTLQNNIAQYNDRHAFIGGPSVWMYLVGGKERPTELTVEAPAGWKIATGMERTGENTCKAADYNWFADAPLEISAEFQEKDFELSGTKYHVIVHDVIGTADFSKFVDDLQKVVAQAVGMWAPVAGTTGQAAPFKEYYFIFHVWPNSGGGLEHLNSTQIDFAKDFDSKDPMPAYGDQSMAKLFVSSHEFFHAWNVKRLRPLPLGPFDYTQMVHTPSLWISEGLTSYYGELNLVRAGLLTPEKYLELMGRAITNFEATPARQERSIEDTSWDTWYSRTVVSQENNLRNTNYSYYDGGQVMGHILDFAIRHDTGNAKSLDDWMRLLYSRYALPKPGFKPEDAVKAANEIAGKDVSELFSKYIAGKEAIPYEEYFGYAGITVEKKIDDTKGWAGASLAPAASDNGHAKISNIIPGSPAESAGLDFGDEIYALDGRPMGLDDLKKALDAHKPGDTVKVMVVRLGGLKEFTMTFAASPYPTYTLKAKVDMTPEQKAIYDSWMGIK
jgi:predicted metalloprotease with PDZ domain